MSIKHPLVGMKIVKGPPQDGEVTKKQITDTLGNVVFEEGLSWLSAIAGTTNQQWTVKLNGNQVITDVTRN